MPDVYSGVYGGVSRFRMVYYPLVTRRVLERARARIGKGQKMASIGCVLSVPTEPRFEFRVSTERVNNPARLEGWAYVDLVYPVSVSAVEGAVPNPSTGQKNILRLLDVKFLRCSGKDQLYSGIVDSVRPLEG